MKLGYLVKKIKNMKGVLLFWFFFALALVFNSFAGSYEEISMLLYGLAITSLLGSFIIYKKFEKKK